MSYKQAIPFGARLIDLQPHGDSRGCFVEIFRSEWKPGVDPVQWNAVRSDAGVLRGVHVHRRHDDYLTVVSGSAVVGLRDLRPDSPTHGSVFTVEMRAEKPAAIVIPHGVAHGFYFPEPSIHIYSVTSYWDPEDELGCYWADPELAIPFPCERPLVSQRDASLPSLATLLQELQAG